MSEKQSNEIKKTFKKIWWFVWESNSVWSWIVNIILAFIIIKFLVYPGLGFMLGTSHPVVAVISGSMEHPDSFDSWWTSKSCCTSIECAERVSQEYLYIPYLITKTEFKDFKFKNGFNKGDMMILSSPKNIKMGDIIVFNVNHRADPIIHRVVSISGKGYTTKGDHNCGSADFEQDVPAERIIGKAAVKVPLLGWIKIGFIGLLKLIMGG